MKISKRIMATLLSIALLCQFSGCEQNEEDSNYMIQLEKVYDGDTVDLCSATVREYLNATDEAEQLRILSEHVGQNLSFQTLSFAWSKDGVSNIYTVHFADNEGFNNEETYETKGTSIQMVGHFVPGNTYYWKVTGDVEGSTSKVDSFKTLDAPVRYITTIAIPNVRDLGGWETEDGKIVKYGLVYRGGKTNTAGANICVEEDKELFAKKLGIKSEVDLRMPNADDGNQTDSVFGDGVFYYKATMTQFNYIFPDFEQTVPVHRSYDKRAKYSLRAIFELLADEVNYPVFIHCNAGADRTGTVAFLINGLLGVSYEDLTKDFELTTFSKSGARWKSGVSDGKFDSTGVFQDNMDNYIAWGKMYDTMIQEYGTGDGKLSSAIENYLMKECKVKQETIDSVRRIMLEDAD